MYKFIILKDNSLYNGHYDKYAFYFYKIINIINSLLY